MPYDPKHSSFADEPRSCADDRPATYDGARNFCVISNTNRSWSHTQEGAEDHAKELLRANQKSSSSTTEFLVVEIVARVRLAAPPIEVTKVKKD